MIHEGEKLLEVDLQKEMRNAYLDYSMSVIVGRALPDVRDGLKPVHRRILYTLFENNITPEKEYRKCADTVGSVLGRYHPHGDASVYDALVRLAQDFSMRYMLVDGHGNFGSVDGDPPAAYRYTEARMSKISMEMLTDIEKETVPFAYNYDNRLKEPLVLPSRFPNLLVNGSVGIAVGMATNIPPHNLGEVIDGMVCLVDNPDATLDDIMQYIKGPDFPTSAMIMGRAGIRAAYATGRGKIVVRSRAEIEEVKNGKSRILVTELPYQVNKANLVKSIAELVRDKRIDGISAVDDHSDREGMTIAIDLKRDAVPQVVLNQLYNYTQMQTTFGTIMLAIVDGAPKVLSLLELLQHYIDFQLDVITRRAQFDLRKARERSHILEGLKIAIDFIDEVMALIRRSKNISEAKERLIERFGLDDLQAQAIVQMRLGQLSGMERQKIEDEIAALAEKIEDILDILSSDTRRRTILKDEAIAVRKRFADDRRTEICTVSGEVDIEDLIPREDCVLTLTQFGYVKRLPVDTYKTQRRGGRGITGMTQREEDVASEMFVINSHDYVLFFTNRGRVYRLKCYEVPEGSRTGKGMNIANLLSIASNEKVTSMIRVSEFTDDSYLVMATAKARIKRIPLSDLNSTRKAGLIAITLEDDDELRWVRQTNGSQSIIVATRQGYANHFHEEQIREMGRGARGVRSIRLREGDEVVGMAITRESGMLLTVSENGHGRLTPTSEYTMHNRGGMGMINYASKKFGEVAAIKVVDMDEDLIIISARGIIIRIHASDVRVCARGSKGVRVMRVDGIEDKVITVARAPRDDEEPVEDLTELSADEPVEEDVELEEPTVEDDIPEDE